MDSMGRKGGKERESLDDGLTGPGQEARGLPCRIKEDGRQMKVILVLATLVGLVMSFVGCSSDSTAPTIAEVGASGITTSGATITWTTDEPATSQVKYGLTAAYGYATSLDKNRIASHSVTLSELEPGTTYYYGVVSVDKAGNQATSDPGEDQTFATLRNPLELANAELVTVQAAIMSCLAEANAWSFDAAVTGWTGDLAGSPKATGSDNVTVTVYAQMQTHEFKAAYTISATGDVTNGVPTIASGWGSKIQWNHTEGKWEEIP